MKALDLLYLIVQYARFTPEQQAEVRAGLEQLKEERKQERKQRKASS